PAAVHPLAPRERQLGQLRLPHRDAPPPRARGGPRGVRAAVALRARPDAHRAVPRARAADHPALLLREPDAPRDRRPAQPHRGADLADPLEAPPHAPPPARGRRHGRVTAAARRRPPFAARRPPRYLRERGNPPGTRPQRPSRAIFFGRRPRAMGCAGTRRAVSLRFWMVYASASAPLRKSRRT